MPAPITGAAGALLALLPLVAIVSHVVRGGDSGLRIRVVREPADPVEMGLVLRLVPDVSVNVPVLQFHCRWEVILLAIVGVCAVVLAFPRPDRIQVVGCF